MPDPSVVAISDTLVQAADRSRQHEWMEAAGLYKAGLALLDPSRGGLEAAKVAMLAAKSYYTAAFQAPDRREFKDRMRLAADYYTKASSLYGRAGSEAFSKLVNSRGLFAEFWLQDEPDEKRKVITLCLEHANEAAKELELAGDRRRLAEANSELLVYYKEALNLAKERKKLLECFDSALRNGRRAAQEFEAFNEDEGLLHSLHSLVFLYLEADHFIEPPAFKELLKEAEQLRGKIAPLTERIGTPLAGLLGGELAALFTGDIDGDMPRARDLCESLAEKAKSVGDVYLIGRLITGASSFGHWAANSEENTERRRALLERAQDLAKKAIGYLEIPRHGAWLKVAYFRASGLSISLALTVETETDKKKALLRNALGIARTGMVYENHAWKSGGIGHECSRALYFLATLEPDLAQRTSLLKEALALREETVRVHNLLSPQSWSMGLMLYYLALLNTELSQTEEDPEKKTQLLQDAALQMQQCVDTCAKWATIPAFMLSLGGYQEWYGDTLVRLYRLTQDSTLPNRSRQAYEDAIALLTTSGNPGRIPPVRWKIAQVYDTIGDYKSASASYTNAAEEYRLGTKRVPGLTGVFEQLASYMNAWALIEEARLYHDAEHYSPAAENYSKAADMISKTRNWNHFSKHYSSCALLEQGEALSRQEKQEEAIESFTTAAELFRGTSTELLAKSNTAPEPAEKRELADWAKIGARREKYCGARTDLERAKVLDRIGEEEASGAKYRSASESFRAMLSESRGEQGRKELETLALFSDAWGKMKEAEVTASPERYREAADSFLEAERTASRKRFRFLALANASMCKALESGTSFRRTRDTKRYSEIKRQLETAADYYQEAGFEKAADWTRATERLFDALAYLAEAELEREPAKRSERYRLAERHLERAATLYDQAGYPKKKQEALGNLQRVREEKELFLNPEDALSNNPAITQVTVAPVSLVRDKSAGLERYETAYVVGSLSVSTTELHIGTELILNIEIGNIGKTTATLIKLENVELSGFKLDMEKTGFRIDDGHVDLKGKRLDYLKTHQIRIVAKAARKGTFHLRPQVFFVDEKGNHASYELEPTSLTVTELGIAGWIKGPGKT